MSEAEAHESAGNRASFASLIASLTGAGKHCEESWDTRDLASDVATISYEQALRKHRRARTESAPHTPGIAVSALPVAHRERTQLRKTASITIRVNQEEQVLLHARAAEAGLSISAYLRSCIFDAESLRAQVKEALAQMQVAIRQAPISKTAAAEPANRRRFRFLSRWGRMRQADKDSAGAVTQLPARDI